MHIPDTMLQGSICPLTAAISAVGITAAAYAAHKTELKPTPIRFAAVTALIFAAQMINFPIQHGTSGHLLGGVLAAALLGIPFGILSTALVLLIQAFFFGDGGLTALGANTLNMACVGAGLGGMLYYYLQKITAKTRLFHAFNLIIAAWVSVVGASFLCSIELALAGTVPFAKVVPAMLITHAKIGIGEAAITFAAYHLFSFYKEKELVPLSTAALLSLIIAPFACSWPDGLEWVAEQYHFLKESLPLIVHILKDYTFPFITDQALSTSLAGISGVIITFAIGWGLGKIFQRIVPGPLLVK